jgi:tetratricopeptide (TPR) repeat protein
MTKTGEAARPTPTIAPEDLGETWLLYQKPIIIGAIVLAVAGGGFWMWRRSGQIREEKASALFSAAEASYMGGNQALAVTEFEKIVARYDGTTSGTQAAMLIAQSLMEQGKHAEGIAQLEAALGSAPSALKPGIYALIGAGNEGAGKPAEAAAAYGRAAAGAQFEVDRDMHRMEQARNLAAASDTAGALKIYQEIAAREDSPFAGEARVRTGELSGK